MACKGNKPNIIYYLKEKIYYNINSLDNFMNNGLNIAIYNNSLEVIDYLVYFEIDINHKDKNGQTPLHLSIQNNKKKFIEKLLFLNASINIKDNNNETPLSLAKKLNMKSVHRKLLFSYFPFNTFYFLYIIFLFLYEVFNQFIILRYFQSIKISLFFFFLFFVNIFLLSNLIQSDPGEIDIRLLKPLSKIVNEGENLRNICIWCNNYTNSCSNHCYICNKCINYQYFHSYLFNNCIGKCNIHLYFEYFIFYFLKITIEFFLKTYELLTNNLKVNEILESFLHLLVNLITILIVFYNFYHTYIFYYKIRNFNKQVMERKDSNDEEVIVINYNKDKNFFENNVDKRYY